MQLYVHIILVIETMYIQTDDRHNFIYNTKRQLSYY